MTFEIRRTKQSLNKRVRENWACWRLILSDCHFDYNTVFFQMTPQQIEEANIAIDIYQEELQKAMKNK